MRKVLSVALIFLLSGCTSVSIPQYIHDKNPYKRTLYASYDQVLETVQSVFEESGWQIESTHNPSVFEQTKEIDEAQAKQVLIFTEVRQTPFFIGTSYVRINIYIRSMNESTTDLEMRYLTVTAIPFKSFKNYKNDRAVERIFKSLEEKLK